MTFPQALIDAARNLTARDALRLVPGEGPIGATLMLIGEAPGAEEERRLRPFVGKAGKNLDEFLELAQIERSACYVTNVVKLRPTAVSKVGRTINRAPTQAEIDLFLPFLQEEIHTVAPRVIVTLGNTPLRALLGKTFIIGSVHGTALSYRQSLLYPMYHPASLIYNPALRDVYREDILHLRRDILPL